MSIMNRLNIHDQRRRYDEVPEHPLNRLAYMRNSEASRKKTFNSWPKDALISCDDLYKDGFYYMGSSDKVQCAYCGGVLSGWQRGDNVNDQHKRHFGKCPQVRGNIVNDDENDLETDGVAGYRQCQNEQRSKSVPKVHNSKYSLYAQRLESYLNWPCDHHMTPDELASAGLYYKGRDDQCHCFMCGGILEAWEKGDIAKEEHKRWLPKCYNSIYDE